MKSTNDFMLMTVNRCIDFTKASRGLKLIPKIDSINLKDTIRLPLNCMKNIQDKIKIRLVPLSSKFHSFILTDKQWLQENLLCLLSNAVKYSGEGEVTVYVSLRSSSSGRSPRAASFPVLTSEEHFSHLLFEVEDTGIGISDEAMKTLFSPFKQAQQLAGGTGLGLYSLAKRIEALNGEYGVRRRRDGIQGSLFWFSIPYHPDGSEAPTDDEKSESISRPTTTKANSVNTQELFSTVKTARIEVEPFACSSKLHILLVEDSPTIAKITSLMLRKHGFKVTVAENGFAGFQKMVAASDGTSEDHFDVVLMDFQMPIMDGIEATRRFREYEQSKMLSTRQLIIGLSATLDTDLIQSGIKAGLDDYILKPISLPNFQATLNKFHLRCS